MKETKVVRQSAKNKKKYKRQLTVEKTTIIPNANEKIWFKWWTWNTGVVWQKIKEQKEKRRKKKLEQIEIKVQWKYYSVPAYNCGWRMMIELEWRYYKTEMNVYGVECLKWAANNAWNKNGAPTWRRMEKVAATKTGKMHNALNN